MRKYVLSSKKSLKADSTGFIPLRFIVILAIIALVVLLIFAEAWFSPASVSHCHNGEQVILSGDFKGFSPSNSTHGTLVYLDNDSFLFHAFDETYMSALIGQRVTITACFHNETVNEFYDFMSAKIQ